MLGAWSEGEESAEVETWALSACGGVMHEALGLGEIRLDEG